MSAKQVNLLLRVVVVSHVVLVLAQAVFAGNFLGGSADALGLHRFNGTAVIMSVALVQCILAVLAWRKKIQPPSFALGSIVLYVAEGAQIGFGFNRMLGLHVPLGTAIFGVALVLALMTFRHVSALPGEPA